MRDAPLREALNSTLLGLLNYIPPWLSGAGVSAAHLRWMVKHAQANHLDWPVDKTGRWIGFVQGTLAAHGYLDVDAERDRTRPFFHKAYREMGIPIPESS